MAAAHHNLPEPLVQQILETRPPLAEQIRQDPQNREFTEQGWEPVYSASPKARIVVIGQAPGRAAQESRIPWNDPITPARARTAITRLVRISRRSGIHSCSSSCRMFS